MSNWIFPDIATVQLMADYRGPIILPQGKIDPMYGINLLGIRKDLFNNRATLSLNGE
ncbi:outer membrane beta-barrel protein [Salegentibacter tibetensis]|uniref:outer membrane beta-barrel protein n=1 Tax=Salegentibacter tibetensis TaxID=2873600 RepID=UPI001F383E07|nr:outer membrane beta-barrel protein [Salegentibacter tibetensis]